MNFNEYQDKAIETAIYPRDGNIIYPLLGLIDEATEVMEKVYEKFGDSDNFTFMKTMKAAIDSGKDCGKLKKSIRDTKDSFTLEKLKEIKILIDSGCLSHDFVIKIKKEIGDVLWYCAALANDFGLKLDDIAEQNINKLKSRKERGVISGSGDDR